MIVFESHVVILCRSSFLWFQNVALGIHFPELPTGVSLAYTSFELLVYYYDSGGLLSPEPASLMALHLILVSCRAISHGGVWRDVYLVLMFSCQVEAFRLWWMWYCSELANPNNVHCVFILCSTTCKNWNESKNRKCVCGITFICISVGPTRMLVYVPTVGVLNRY